MGHPPENRPLVSVCVPTFNDARFLGTSLESILAQTYERLEVLVADDCSTDATHEIVASYSDSRIRYHRNERNLGQFANVNACIGRATGEFIAVFHSDDLYEPRIIEREVAFLQRFEEAGAVFTRDRWIDSDGRVIGETRFPPGVPVNRPFSFRDVLPVLLRRKNCVFRGPSAMCRADVFRRVGLFDTTEYVIAGDFEFWLRILMQFRIGIIDEPLMRYRQDPSQVSRRYNVLRTEEEDFFSVLDRYIEASGLAPAIDSTSRFEYSFHRRDDETVRAANLFILGRYREARELLARPFPWRALVVSFRRRKMRVLLLRALLDIGLRFGPKKPLARLLVRTEYGGRLPATS